MQPQLDLANLAQTSNLVSVHAGGQDAHGGCSAICMQLSIVLPEFCL